MNQSSPIGRPVTTEYVLDELKKAEEDLDAVRRAVNGLQGRVAALEASQ